MQPAQKLDTPPMPRETMLRLYREMVRLRTIDERMMTLQRHGRGFYGACTGQTRARSYTKGDGTQARARSYTKGDGSWVI